jgi:ABC-2 type transport system permease protein
VGAVFFRVLIIGGVLSYRALFSWLSPWILIPALLVTPVFQILFFAFIGQSAHVGNNGYFLLGNAIQYASIPCLFGMGNTIEGERTTQTLGLLLVSPASRLALFGGRALPVVLNGLVVSLFALVVGGLLLRVSIPVSAFVPLLVIIAVCAFSCTGLGLLTAATALRVREVAVLVNILYGILLIFCGVNAPLKTLPYWMRFIANGLPLTHGIEAARLAAAGASLSQVGLLLGQEALVGAIYGVIGLLTLRVLETDSRRRATLELA